MTALSIANAATAGANATTGTAGATGVPATGTSAAHATPAPNTPLAGITVLDFGQIYQGPYATLLMARAGANVIKIEPPSGEPLRRNHAGTGTRLAFAMLNSNKRAITLNLKTERGRALLTDMVRRADVLLENFSPARWTILAWATTCSPRPIPGWCTRREPASASAGRIATRWRWT